jgi:hypothetical protein
MFDTAEAGFESWCHVDAPVHAHVATGVATRHCKIGAFQEAKIPTSLLSDTPFKWWAVHGLNMWPLPCQRVALVRGRVNRVCIVCILHIVCGCVSTWSLPGKVRSAEAPPDKTSARGPSWHLGGRDLGLADCRQGASRTEN